MALSCAALQQAVLAEMAAGIAAHDARTEGGELVTDVGLPEDAVGDAERVQATGSRQQRLLGSEGAENQVGNLRLGRDEPAACGLHGGMNRLTGGLRARKVSPGEDVNIGCYLVGHRFLLAL